MRNIQTALAAILISTFFIMSCSKDDSNTNSGTANIMLIHTSPNAPSFDVYDDTTKINTVTELVYSAGTNYLPIVTGNKVLTIKQAGTSSTVFSTAALSFVKNKSYSLFIVDSLSKIAALRLEDNLSIPASGKTNFRILHLSPNTPNVDFILRSGADSIPITNKTFKQIPDLLAIDAKTYTIKAKLAGTQTTIAFANNLTLSSGKIYTLFLKGFIGGIGSEALDFGYVENN